MIQHFCDGKGTAFFGITQEIYKKKTPKGRFFLAYVQKKQYLCTRFMLPVDFIESMHQLLGTEAQLLIQSLETEPVTSIRLNNKLSNTLTNLNDLYIIGIIGLTNEDDLLPVLPQMVGKICEYFSRRLLMRLKIICHEIDLCKELIYSVYRRLCKNGMNARIGKLFHEDPYDKGFFSSNDEYICFCHRFLRKQLSFFKLLLFHYLFHRIPVKFLKGGRETGEKRFITI